MNFLANLVKVFPALKTRPLHLTGESYCGTYIVRCQCLSVVRPTTKVLVQPYITKTYFGMKEPPVKLERIAIGDGAIGSFQEFALLPMVSALLLLMSACWPFPKLSVLETYPQLISYDPDVYNYFKEQCVHIIFNTITHAQVFIIQDSSLWIRP